MSMCVTRRLEDTIPAKTTVKKERQKTTFSCVGTDNELENTGEEGISDNDDDAIASVLQSMHPTYGTPMRSDSKHPPYPIMSPSPLSPPAITTGESSMSNIDERDATRRYEPEPADCTDFDEMETAHGGATTYNKLDTRTMMSGFQTPLVNDYTTFALSHLEDQRLRLIGEDEKMRLTGHDPSWDRKAALGGLADLMIDAAAACRADDPSLLTKCFDEGGLKLWKKEFGNGRMVIRVEWFVPMKPKLYCNYASDHRFRHEWDTNTTEIRCLEVVNPFVDIAYIATKRIATVYPRDMINLKTKRPLTKDVENGPYGTASCSITHPAEPVRKDRVRMELKLGGYAAIPVQTPEGIWSKISLFQEGDVKGWIPSAVSQMVAVKVVPKSTEKVVKGALTHYGIDWKGEGCSNAYEYAWKKIEGWIKSGQMKKEDIESNCDWKQLNELREGKQKK
eukprot:GDKJ01019399.1.p1 GENE.GDKJ01019399.1~~GDKJ01019399.1.p1  ORF type:complete len:472 (+),score=105.82 GDKJ01019399.1:69-1418(+)